MWLRNFLREYFYEVGKGRKRNHPVPVKPDIGCGNGYCCNILYNLDVHTFTY